MTHSAPPIEVSVAESAFPELVEAFGKLIPQLSGSAPPLTLAAVADIIAAPATTLLIARDPLGERRIVGTLTLVIFRIPTAIRAWIEDVVVDESARGRGVGEALVQAAVKLAAERGAKTLDLTSRTSRKAAHRLYEKSGFHVRETSVYRYGPKPSS
jgi:ribosomal protein S18 acetylase RimI-like enzyme